MDVRSALKRQYHAAFAMLRQTVERCPDDLWVSTAHPNATWHVAYHALFYGHLYLMPDEASFAPWEKHREEHQFLGSVPWPPHEPPKLGEPYTRAELLTYLRLVDDLVDPTLDEVDLAYVHLEPERI